MQRFVTLAVVLCGLTAQAYAQPLDRITFNDQELFLNGGNVAWVNFARDIGPGQTNLNRFEAMFQQLHENGGNAMRLWLHTTGAVSPEWSGSAVVGPGVGAIDDLRAILDLAWEHEIGMMLCLWSFDMLRISNGTTITDRAYGILTNPTLTQTYIDNALVPMVEALADHPAIIAWEIFNEPEGMSNEHGWSINRHVPMSDIQRFINRTAGAIHSTAPEASVTNGSWAFIASSDVTPTGAAAKTADQLTAAELQHIQQHLSQKYRHPFSLDETRAFYTSLHPAANYNYYTDDRLIAAGGDALGVLDFYTVHYYEWAGTALSPFHHDAEVWALTKPVAIAEFFMGGGSDGNDDATYGIPYQNLYTTLFDRGYAGALGWQWYNYPNSAEGVVNWPRILESTQTIFDLYPAAVDIALGLRIASFRADPPGIEAGQQSVLSWSVSGAASITLDGVPVDSVGTQTVSPTETTTYTLEAEARADGETVAQNVTVTVLDPNEVNRARIQPAVASTIETCCGDILEAELAFDGNPNTRWSSEWQEGLADEDPDDEWIYVDLGSAYSIERIMLAWEVAYGSSYDIDVSYDAQIWTTVYQERSGDGGTDEITFAIPPSARYVRMHGLTRATQYGYSLWEFEVYGLPSARQPPVVALTAPLEGAVVAPGADLMLTAEASDPDGSVQQVAFYVDGVMIGEASDAPFSITWPAVSEGEHTVTAVATDDDGIAVSSMPFLVFALDTSAFPRYEAEAATLDGDMSVESTVAGASGNSYLYIRDSGTLTFDNVTVDTWGIYLVTFRYYLPFGFKAQYLNVNGERVAELAFDGPTEQWLERAVKVPLRPGVNTIQLEKYWGWMYFDYVGIGTEALNVAIDEANALPETFSLSQNYPNPFNPETVITYALPSATHVRLDVFDLTGRRVATLADGLQPPGTHTLPFEARSLASGVYVYRIQAGAFTQTKRMVLLR